jgi:F-type H+-transporting ATPase subunit b
MSFFLIHPLILAAEESHGAAAANPVAFQWVPFVSALVIFGIVFFILAKFVWPKILGGLEDRANKIRSEVFAAEELRKAAAEEKKQFDRALTDARAESARIIEQTKAEQFRLAADLRAKAEVELNAMREEAKANIEAAKRAAINEIYAETAALATSVAGKILKREVNAHDQQRLVEESVNQFGREYARS